MNKIALFLENKEIELNSEVQFAITRTWEDLTNPTTIINDWSKTVEIPFTNRNNQIFGHIYCPDKVIVDGGSGDMVGVYFNPYLKLDMRLIYNGMPLMVGYAKMNSVKKSGGKGAYNITLCGELGKVFQEMKKITFDATAYPEGSGSTYYIDGSKYIAEYMNQGLIYSSWTTGYQRNWKLKEKGETAYRLTDIIGWAPNNSFSEGFDYKTFQLGEYSAKTFSDVINEVYTASGKSMDGETLIGEGMLPREIGEFRSYHQMPFIYFNKLFQMLQYKAEEITGYKFVLDSDWFKNFNPYWYRIVMMLQKFENGKETTKQNNYATSLSNMQWVWTAGGTIVYNEQKEANLSFVETGSSEQVDIFDFTNQRFNLQPDQNGTIVSNNELNFSLRFNREGYDSNVYFNEKNGLIINVVISGANGTVVTKKVLIISENCDPETDTDHFPDFNKDDYALIIRVGSAPDDYWENMVRWNISQSLSSFMDYYTFGDYASYSMNAIWYNNSAVLRHNSVDLRSNDVRIVWNQNPYTNVSYNTYSFRSNSYFTFNDLWNNDYNLFDVILNYCKMYRIVITVDDLNKTINFVQASKYFSGYTIEDWTAKVDFARDYTIKPITFENKYVLFNYEDDDTKMDKVYQDKYGIKFGEVKLITDYNFNDETKELFENVTPSFVNTDNCLSWTNIYNYQQVKYSFPAETYVYSKDADGKFQSNFGAFLFHCGLSSWDTEEKLRMRPVWISDDTDYQVSSNIYFYTQMDKYETSAATYPHLDIVYGNNMCVYGVPAECWTYNNNYEGKSSIYHNFWENYVNERYNVQNKVLTCYVYLSPIDYYNFRFNKFIKIENQLYFVNKIYDYNVSSLAPTKVDLITIQNIEGYTTTNYN